MRFPALFLVIAMLTILPSRAESASITSFAGFNFSGTNVAEDGMLLTPFDPALGDLVSVFVGVQGTLSVGIDTAFMPLPPPPAGPGGLSPYPYSVTIANDMFGLFGNLFDFSPEAPFVFSGVASGAGEIVPAVRAFTYGFTLTEVTDLIGFATVATSGVDGAPLAVAQRSDFLPAVHGQYALQSLFKASVMQGLVEGVTMAGGGTVQVTYTYEERLDPPTPVPEPATWLLVASGALATVARRSIV